MQQSKKITQYSNKNINISVIIDTSGNVIGRNILLLHGINSRIKRKERNNKNKKYFKEYNNIHKEERKEYYKQYYKDNKEHILKITKQYTKTENGKETRRKQYATRKGLGFNTLNNPFPNCEGHHLNYEDVIFIPYELHRSISHSVTQNRNMHEINTLAIDYYWKERFKKYGVIK